MEEKEIILTYEGLKALEDELEYLKNEKRTEIAERIKVALAFGDLSENSEYDEAKNDQAAMENRIVQLENMLKNAKVIDEDKIGTDKVGHGNKVKVYDFEFKEEVEYQIVGSAEANPAEYKISNESPIGSALMGRKVGDKIDVVVPSGDTIKLEVRTISK